MTPAALLRIDSSKATEQIVDFINSVFTQAGKAKAIVAVSGGVDSATSLLLAARALGPERVEGLHLPAKASAPIHTQHAQLVMDTAEIPAANRLTINISAIIQKSWRIIQRSTPGVGAAFTPGVNQLRLANLAARSRMLVLYDQAKRLDALVVGTENRSEHLLGYFTRFGDEASDLEPLRHLYKTQVISLARHLGVPPVILDKTPSADLWRGQRIPQPAAQVTHLSADPAYTGVIHPGHQYILILF